MTTLALGDLGPRTSALVVAGSVRAELATRLHRLSGAAPTLAPGELRAVEEIPAGVRAIFDRAAVEVEVLASDAVRLTWSPSAAPGS